MFKLNIQLFNGTQNPDLKHQVTYDDEKYIVVPGINGIEYRVNKDILDKVPKGFFENKEEAYREAIVMMSYYLTYGKQAPSRKEIKAYTETYLKQASVPIQGIDTREIFLYDGYNAKSKKEIQALQEKARADYNSEKNLKTNGERKKTYEQIYEMYLETYNTDDGRREYEAINPGETGYAKHIFSDLENMLENSLVLDHETGEPVIKAGPFDGYAPKNAYAKVGVDDTGRAVYQLDNNTFITVKEDMEKNRDKTITVLGVGDSFKFDKDQSFYDITDNGAVRRDDGSELPERGDDVDDSASFNNVFDDYYNDVYSMEEGTLGRRVVDNKAKLLEQEARNQQIIAETNLQNQALQQAQTVKQITDSLKSERLAKLRAGMNASQLADQDMQILLSNVQALNQQVVDTNQLRMEGLLNQGTAYESAMAEYLGNADTIGQVATGMTAAGASNAALQTEQSMNTLYGANWRNLPNANALYNEQYNIATTGNPKGNVTPER